MPLLTELTLFLGFGSTKMSRPRRWQWFPDGLLKWPMEIV
jgi:hypothetical protein